MCVHESLLGLGVAGGALGIPVAFGVTDCLSDKYITFSFSSNWQQLFPLEVSDVWQPRTCSKSPSLCWAVSFATRAYGDIIFLLAIKCFEPIEPDKYGCVCAFCFMSTSADLGTTLLCPGVSVVESTHCCCECKPESDLIHGSFACLFSRLALLFCLLSNLTLARCTTYSASSEHSVVGELTV